MSMSILSNLDLNKNQLLNATLQQLSSDITASGNKGVIFYNTTSDRVKVSNGSSIDTITNILESVSINATANGLSVGSVSSKNQVLTLALADGSNAGAMSSSHYSLVNGATDANTASAIVKRDASGNFTAGTITAALTGTASNASQLNSQSASYYLSRTNHTGTQTASTISDFDTQVRTSRLDQMAAPTAAVSFNSQRITNLTDPSGAQDAATKNYVDSVATGLDVKASVRAASTANVSVTYNSTNGTSARGQITAAPNTLDGVSLAANNRILLKDQSTGAQNGIWVVSTLGNGANGVWDRATDFDADAEVTAGAFTFVEEGTTNADSGWVLTTNNPITIGGSSGTALAFAQFSGAGTITAGNGLTKTGSTIDVVGTSGRISVAADSIDIDSGYVGQSSITTLGTITTGTWTGTAIAVANGGTGATSAASARSNLSATGKYATNLSGSSTSYTVTHNLGTTDIVIMIQEVSTGNYILTDVQATTTNTATVSFAVAPSSNAYRAIVVG